MEKFKNIRPEILLRLGLGLMFLYSGQSLLREPWAWYGFAPNWFVGLVQNFFNMDVFLRIQGIGELAIAGTLLAWFMPRKAAKWASILASLHILAILTLGGVDLVTFRDIGILGGSLALSLLLSKEVS